MNEARPVSTLVVDDEPLARAGLARLLAEVEWLRVVGEAASGPAALESIERWRPELVFLDIQMPGFSGTDLLPRLTHRPLVVFTTAFAQHAVTAFELGALDYLLKPFGEERLAAALERVRATIGEPHATLERYGELFQRAPISRLFVRSGRSIVPIAVADIAWFEAVGDYIAAHVGASTHLLHLSLNQLEERLDPAAFLRLHRGHIVNLACVASFQRQTDASLVAVLRDGTRLAVSRARAQELRALARE